MRKFFFVSCIIVISIHCKAQYFEAGLTTGLTSYIGDLQPADPATGSFGTTYGALIRYHYRPNISFKAMGTIGGFYATDRYARGSRIFRNLEAQTQMMEFGLTAEYNLTRYEILDGKTTAPYVFAGIAALKFTPKARYEGQWVDIRNLGTEGQTLPGGKKYVTIGATIPVGIGIKLALGRRFNLGFEGGLRFTFSDYLDDVSGNYPDLQALKEQNPVAAAMSFRTPEVKGSQLDLPSGAKRGDSYKNDLYYYIGATLTYNLARPEKMEFNPSYRNFTSRK